MAVLPPGATARNLASYISFVTAEIGSFAIYKVHHNPFNTPLRCVFRNPAPGVPAGRLIDEAGLKGSHRQSFKWHPVTAELCGLWTNRTVDPLRIRRILGPSTYF